MFKQSKEQVQIFVKNVEVFPTRIIVLSNKNLVQVLTRVNEYSRVLTTVKNYSRVLTTVKNYSRVLTSAPDYVAKQPLERESILDERFSSCRLLLIPANKILKHS